MVAADPVRVEQDLAAGVLGCPGCGGALGRWGFARRRRLRDVAGWLEVRPRRGRCRACRSTHVLLPGVALLRRVDLARVIGRALLAKAQGRGHRQVAAELGVPATTVRGWLRRFAERAEQVRGHFTRLAVWLDPQAGPICPRGSPLADAVEAIGSAAVAAARRFGSGLGPFEFASGATGGRLLCNTNAPFPVPW
jgi:transposase-like protein